MSSSATWSNRITNSSPPKRATESDARIACASREPICCSSQSPLSWPRLSLTTLKRSTSMNTTANRPPRAARAGERVLEAVAEQRAVGQPGQRVVQRLVGERVGGRLLGADVLDLGDEVQRLAVLPAHEPRGHRGPHRVPVGVQVALLACPRSSPPSSMPSSSARLSRRSSGAVISRPGHAFQLLAGAAEHVAERRVDAREAAVRGGEAHADHRRRRSSSGSAPRSRARPRAPRPGPRARARSAATTRSRRARRRRRTPRGCRPTSTDGRCGRRRGTPAWPLPSELADAVVEDDVERREQERDPVLVERQHDDHHEEVEVRLDVAAGDVDDERRCGQQAGGDDRRAQLAAVGEAVDDRGGGHRRGVERRVPDREALSRLNANSPATWNHSRLTIQRWRCSQLSSGRVWPFGRRSRRRRMTPHRQMFYWS